MTIRQRSFRLSAGLFFLTTALTATPPPEGNDLFDELTYRHVGPVGNRVIAVVGEPGNPNVYYAGAASGGVWKTTDGGAHWEPMSDDLPASSIGSLAVAPSDPNVVWAGTGETFLRANVSIGNGIYRSSDRGRHWEHRGLMKTGRIGRVVVHPKDPDTVFAAALGHVYGPQEERGVYRTRDGGKTWERVLHVDARTGGSDLVMDPTNPRILFAGMWEVEINTWSRRSGGPGSGLYTSRDGGDTWEEVEAEGLPKKPWGKIGLAMSAADPDRVYALIETNTNRDFAPVEELQGVLWRSDDGGETWAMVNASNDLVQRPLYYSRMAAAPGDADELYFMAVRHSTSLDGGKTAFRTEAQPGWDHHDMWIDPTDGDRMIVGHDGGVSISTNHGRSWHRPQLPIAQMYHAAVDDRIPYFVYGNRQDGSASRGPSNTLTDGGIPIGEWRSVGGCEVGFTVPDPVDTDVVWTGCYDGILDRHNLKTGISRDVSVWPDKLETQAAIDLKYRFQWTFPLILSPHDHERVYAGSQFVHRTTDGGESWEVVSPDLTTNDPELQQRTGGLTLDDAGPTIAPVVFALAESPLEEGLLWAGTNDGQVQLRRDGVWTNVTASLPDLPPRGTVSNVEPSRHAAGTAYLTVDRHQLGDTATYVYRTGDYGATWTKIVSGVPQDLFGYAHCVREDPLRPGLLYLGTENGVYVSFDDGAGWRSLQSNLPRAPVHWLVVQERFGDLVVATYGRGFWILDDLTPVRQLADSSLGEEPRLFAPRPAYRFRLREGGYAQPEDPAAGENPEYGASLHYYLPKELGEDDELELVVLDGEGEVVRTLEDPERDAGLHRVYWDLRYEKTREVRLRTKPEENPHVPLGDGRYRTIRDLGRLSILAPPGTYTVRLSLGEQEWTEELQVLQDPTTGATAEDLAAQTEVVFELRDMLDRAAAAVNEIEWLRRQVDDLKDRLADEVHPTLLKEEDVEAVRDSIEALDGKLKELERSFFDLRLTGASQDSLRWSPRLYSKIAFLAWGLSDADFRPTTQQREVFEILRGQLEEREAALDEIVEDGVAGLTSLLSELGVTGVLTGWRSGPRARVASVLDAVGLGARLAGAVATLDVRRRLGGRGPAGSLSEQQGVVSEDVAQGKVVAAGQRTAVILAVIELAAGDDDRAVERTQIRAARVTSALLVAGAGKGKRRGGRNRQESRKHDQDQDVLLRKHLSSSFGELLVAAPRLRGRRVRLLKEDAQRDRGIRQPIVPSRRSTFRARPAVTAHIADRLRLRGRFAGPRG